MCASCSRMLPTRRNIRAPHSRARCEWSGSASDVGAGCSQQNGDIVGAAAVIINRTGGAALLRKPSQRLRRRRPPADGDGQHLHGNTAYEQGPWGVRLNGNDDRRDLENVLIHSAVQRNVEREDAARIDPPEGRAASSITDIRRIVPSWARWFFQRMVENRSTSIGPGRSCDGGRDGRCGYDQFAAFVGRASTPANLHPGHADQSELKLVSSS